MADEILNCDGTDEIHVPDWSSIVGDKTLENGGYFGDLLQITRAHLEDAKEKGELGEEDSGAAYATAIMEAMKSSISFEISGQKSINEICYLRAQSDKIRQEIEELILSRKRALLELRMKVFTDLYSSKNIDNIPTIVDGTYEHKIDELYQEVLDGDISEPAQGVTP